MAVDWLSDSQQSTWRAYLLGTTLLNDRLDRDLRRTFDISLVEYEILVRLDEASGRSMRMAALADAVKNSRSRITHTVARMEHDGLVERRACSSDGRGVTAHLTARGRNLLTRAAPLHVEGVRDSLVDLVDPDDLEAVGRVFRAVASHLDPAEAAELPTSA